MRAPAIDQRQSDPAAGYSLAWTGAAAFLLLVTRDPPDPGLFLPVAFAALPFAAAPRHRVAFRVLAAALLLAYVAMRGPTLESLVFVPPAAGLLLSAYQQRQAQPQRGGRKRKRSRR